MITRRSLLSFASVIGVSLISTSAFASKADEDALSIIRQYQSIKSMSGKFVQFDQKNGQIEGTFHIVRPGKARFEYEDDSLVMVADGRSVGIQNRKLDTWTLYPLSKTPMKVILSDNVDYEKIITRTKTGTDTVSMNMENRKELGDFRIELMFDKDGGALRQWVTIDPNGYETTLVIFDVSFDNPIPDHMFRIPYKDIRKN